MRLRRLESPQNPIIRQALKVRDRRPGRRGAAFLVEGPNLVASALEAGAGLGSVFVTEGFRSKRAPRAMLNSIARRGGELYEVSEKILRRLAETETPQGIAAVASLRPASLEEIRPDGPIVVLDAVQDPGNVGTIIRTSDAAGASAVVVLGGTCDPFMPKALRASAGSIFNIPLVYAARKELPGELRRRGIGMVVTASDAETSVFDAELRGPLAIVFGNEARGVGRELREAADIEIRIPVRGGAESLNVASSAAVCLYEVLRRKKGA